MISAIVASSENNVIGKDNKLIWTLKSDLRRFKELTTGNTVIMGRKTFESIGKPLKDRLNIIISRDKKLKISGVIVVNSIEEAIRKSPNNKRTFIIGGSEIYKQSIEYIDRIIMTKVHCEVDGDSYFMSDEEITNNFNLQYEQKFLKDGENKYDYSMRIYDRK